MPFICHPLVAEPCYIKPGCVRDMQSVNDTTRLCSSMQQPQYFCFLRLKMSSRKNMDCSTTAEGSMMTWMLLMVWLWESREGRRVAFTITHAVFTSLPPPKRTQRLQRSCFLIVHVAHNRKIIHSFQHASRLNTSASASPLKCCDMGFPPKAAPEPAK